MELVAFYYLHFDEDYAYNLLLLAVIFTFCYASSMSVLRVDLAIRLLMHRTKTKNLIGLLLRTFYGVHERDMQSCPSVCLKILNEFELNLVCGSLDSSGL
jgi:hypothetical protein